MKLEGKRLLLLGGTNSTEEILNFANKNKVTLIATGPQQDTPLKKIAKESYDINALNEDDLYNLVIEKNIDGIFVGCNETVVPHAINVAHKAKKPCYCNLEQWNHCANKSKFKAMCKKYNIPVTEEFLLKDVKQTDFPLITKPADSCGSQGFSISNTFAELKENYEYAKKFSSTNHVLIEKYMPYDTVIIHYTLIDGEIIFSGISDKKSMKLKDYGSSVMALQLFPSINTADYLEELNEKVIHMFKSENFHDGPIWIEAFNNNGKFIFNEMGYRFGGSMTYHPVNYFYNINQLDLILEYSLTGNYKKYPIINNIPKNKKYCILPLHVNPGKISKIIGEQQIKENNNLFAYVPIHYCGDYIQKTGTVSQVFCYLHVLYNDFSDLKITIKNILNQLKVFNENNEEMLFCLFDINSLQNNTNNQSISIKVISQKEQLLANCFNIEESINITKQTLLDYTNNKILYPNKVCQVFNDLTQDRINCLPATLLTEKICGMKWVSVFPENPQKFGVQNLSATILLSEINKGFPLALLDGTLCSNLRTASVSAVAASYLAKKDSKIIGFIGAGEQAKMHFIAMKYVFPNIKVCKVSSRTTKSENNFIKLLSKLYPDVDFIACNSSYETAVKNSDIVVSAISGQECLLKSDWIEKGMFYCHVAGLEDEYKVPLMADKIVCDNWQMVKHRTQTISLLYKMNKLKDENIYADLNEIVSGLKNGRENDNEFIYFNAVGLSYVDVALAYHFYKKILKTNLGKNIQLQEKPLFDNFFQLSNNSQFLL